MAESRGLSAAVFGATGLVGTHCLRLLLAQPTFDRVVAPTRRPLPTGATKGAVGLEEHIVDFDRLEEHAALLDVDRVFCALGTTMRQAGSKPAFRRVDHDLPLRLARMALERGVPHFLLVSAVGADDASRVFYNRVKGELEAALLALPFGSTTVVRPSLLIGPRERPRPAELLGEIFGLLVPGRYRPVRVADVARVLVAAAVENRPGPRIIESEEIRALARGERQEKP